MNHILNIIKFYKDLKISDTTAITNLFNFVNCRKITYENFVFVIANDNENKGCPYCFENIYNEQKSLISIELNKHYFYLNKAKNQIFEQEFNIIDFIHKKSEDNILNTKTIEDFFILFPTFDLIFYPSVHNHLKAAKISAPFLNCDANFIFENTYELNWYLKTFLITNNDLDVVFEDYLRLLERFQKQEYYTIISKRNKRYYLYLFIIENDDISIYEACGIVITDTVKINYLEIVKNLKEKYKKRRI